MFDNVDLKFLRDKAWLKWGRYSEDMISLSVADIDFPPPKEIIDEISATLKNPPSPYNDYIGEHRLIQAIIKKLKEKNKIKAKEEDILVIPGSMFAIFLACYITIKPGDEVIICPAPVYGPFIKNIKNSGGIPVFIELKREKEYKLDINELKDKINHRTKLIMICNPHNPTGKLLTRDELLSIGKLAVEKGLIIFSDELYEDMIYEGRHTSIASLSEDIFNHTLSCFGFSKAFGIAGFRIAYLLGRGRLMQEIKDRFHYMMVHTDTLAQAAGFAALKYGKNWLTKFIPHLKKMRDFGYNRLKDILREEFFKPQATPFFFPYIGHFGLSSLKFADFLKQKAKVVVNSGEMFGPGGEGFIRINFATSFSILNEAFLRIEKAIKSL